MVRKITLVLAALALGMLLVNLYLAGVLFQTLYLTITIVGLVMSVFYLSTWGYWAIRAWRDGKLRFATITVLEFVIIPVLAIPSFGTALYNVMTLGWAVVPDPRVRASRLIGLTALFLVMLLRNLNWVRRWRKKSVGHQDVQEAISDSNPV